MIYDRIENIDTYKLDSVAVEFIKNLSSDIECKKHILSDNIYANVEEYTTKDVGYFEAHRDYLDIQILLSGEEIIEYTPLIGLKTKDEYDKTRDIEFFFDGESQITPIKLQKGLFTVLYPQDAHKPQLKFKSNMPVKKVVVKVKLN